VLLNMGMCTFIFCIANFSNSEKCLAGFLGIKLESEESTHHTCFRRLLSSSNVL